MIFQYTGPPCRRAAGRRTRASGSTGSGTSLRRAVGKQNGHKSLKMGPYHGSDSEDLNHLEKFDRIVGELSHWSYILGS